MTESQRKKLDSDIDRQIKALEEDLKDKSKYRKNVYSAHVIPKIKEADETDDR